MVVDYYIRHIVDARKRLHAPGFPCEKILCANGTIFIWPEATSIVIEDFYMDDYLNLLDDVNYAIKNNRDLVSLFNLEELV